MNVIPAYTPEADEETFSVPQVARYADSHPSFAVFVLRDDANRWSRQSARDELSDSEIIHWDNQRAEDSENRSKELKRDFGGDTLPCSDFKANALSLLISALSYNLFALMRQLLPEE